MDLTDRFREAFDYAFELHERNDRHRRKGTEIPYMSHLLSVAGLVLEHGGSEDQAIAALLHDAVEDQGGLPVLEEIRRRFGDGVARIVDDCSDAYEEPKPPWQQRKEGFLEDLAGMPATSLLVVAADKLHNARSVLTDWRVMGDAIFDRFQGGKEGTLWYFRAIADRLLRRGPRSLADELDRAVRELEVASADPGPDAPGS